MGRDNYNIEFSCSYTVGGTCDLHIKECTWRRYYRNNLTSACSCKFKVTSFTSLIASIINSIMGVILAWVLVRYDFPFKRVS